MNEFCSRARQLYARGRRPYKCTCLFRLVASEESVQRGIWGKNTFQLVKLPFFFFFFNGRKELSVVRNFLYSCNYIAINNANSFNNETRKEDGEWESRQHLPSIPDVIQHPYLEHLQWGMMSCIRERIKRNGTAEEGGPISSHSLTRGIKRYHVLDASNRTHTSLYRAICTLLRCFEPVVIETVSKRNPRHKSIIRTIIFLFDYYSSIGGRSSLLGSNDTTIFIFFLLFLVMVRPLLCRTVAKKSRASENVSTVSFRSMRVSSWNFEQTSFSLSLSFSKDFKTAPYPLLSRRFD